MLEVLQAKSHGHLHELESNSIMIPDLQIPWIYILLEMDLQPLRLVSLVGDCSEISRSWSPTIAGTCSLWQSSRKSPTALRPSYDVRAASLWPMHDHGHQKISATIDDQRRPSYDGCTLVSDILKTAHDHQRPLRS